MYVEPRRGSVNNNSHKLKVGVRGIPSLAPLDEPAGEAFNAVWVL